MAFVDTCVLKPRFYYYSGTVRPTDQEIVTIEEFVANSPQEKGAPMPCHAMWGSTRLVRRQKEWGRNQERAFLVVSVARN